MVVVENFRKDLPSDSRFGHTRGVRVSVVSAVVVKCAHYSGSILT